MQNKAIRNFSLFGDEAFEEADELLQLNGALLLDRVLQLKSADCIQSLRQAIVDLKHNLHKPEHDLRAKVGNGHIVELSKNYLFNDLNQIAEAHTLERALYYVERLIKSITEVRTSVINDINLNRWKEYQDVITDSLWVIERRDSSGMHTAGYWGNFIPQIPNQMMRRYTKKGDWVLDTFAGLGTTLLEGQRLGRNTIGIELQPAIAEKARHLIAQEPNRHGVVSEIIVGDNTHINYHDILQCHGRQSVQLVIMHPPYFDIIKFSDDPRDLSNAGSVEAFLEMIGRAVDNVAPALDQGRYLVLVIGDKYAQGDWIPLGFQSMNEVLKRGFSLKSIIVKNFDETTGKRNQKELWRYRALVGGFYIFKHEYIFLFRKLPSSKM